MKTINLNDIARALVVLLFFLAITLLFAANEAVSDNYKQCECEFSSHEFEGFGTDAACSFVMSNDYKSCEISFAGAGADQVGLLFNEEQDEDLAIAMFLNSFRSIDMEINDPEVIMRATKILASGALERSRLVEKGVPVEEMYFSTVEFVAENMDEIETIFNESNLNSTVKEFQDGEFSVGYGWIEHRPAPGLFIRIVYF